MTTAWLDRHMTVACTIYSRVPASDGSKDEYGNVVYEEVPHPSRCFIQPVSQDELGGGTIAVSRFQVHLPASIVGLLDSFARLEVDGVSYEAVEDAAVFTSLISPGPHHVELVVQEATTDEI